MKRNDLNGKTFAGLDRKTVVAAFVFIVVGFLALTLPDHPGAFHLRAFRQFPLEIPIAALVLLFLSRRLATPVAALLALAVFTLLFLKIADTGVEAAFQRRFNPYLDIKMMVDGWNLVSGTFGTATAALVLTLVFATFIAALVIFFIAARHLAAIGQAGRRTMIKTFGVALTAGVILFAAGPSVGLQGVANLRAGSYLEARLSLVARSVADMSVFEKQLAAPETIPAGSDLFAAIRGRDVVLIFVESYGRSAVEDPRYSPIMKPRLASVEKELDAAGFASASGWSVSPTVGGISWLAHGTFLSGLWIDSQARYDRLMISKRPSLNRLFSQAGWQTAAVMPAITMPWPEADYFGYDKVLVAKDLGYRGKPYNWVTMPDQYTLSALDRLVRQPAREAGKPVMVETALISSHAPWTPVAKLIDWADVKDGTAFNDQATSGDSPSVVWSDPERVRQQYIGTIDYSLQTVGDYIAHFGKDAVFIILGDHQPAAIVTGQGASRAVPIHIVSRDKALIDRFEAEGYAAGMTPGPDTPEQPMDGMRDRLIRVFGAATS
ncbi:sulfatase-like hydrolase/transferase [Rhizobium halophytocola]|uniref:Sulfatase N-terminal domain-containing protein n=1 Tax=Rhizobium halophytocola TaxID=735519 RepID=A0ABS4DUV1_9HYPH|nr:sulfatase-like hydrolase/transferase [Rhizobium halophytocola]MBP1849476.1 hypothetical protein [Rhizobium halophytocola]